MKTLVLNPVKAVALVSVALIALAGTASAGEPQAPRQGMCGDRGQVLSTLDGGYKEHPTAMGLASNGTVVEVLSSEEGTWTIIVTAPNGVSCLMAAGDYWQSLPKPTAELTL